MRFPFPPFDKRERTHKPEGDGTCRGCDFAGRCGPEDRCAVHVRVVSRDGQVEDCLCWPAESPRKMVA